MDAERFGVPELVPRAKIAAEILMTAQVLN
jgi:hypothetical protein